MYELLHTINVGSTQYSQYSVRTPEQQSLMCADIYIYIVYIYYILYIYTTYYIYTIYSAAKLLNSIELHMSQAARHQCDIRITESP